MANLRRFNKKGDQIETFKKTGTKLRFYLQNGDQGHG